MPKLKPILQGKNVQNNKIRTFFTHVFPTDTQQVPKDSDTLSDHSKDIVPSIVDTSVLEQGASPNTSSISMTPCSHTIVTTGPSYPAVFEQDTLSDLQKISVLQGLWDPTVAERSFSAVKRIKTPLRNTMTNVRLTALALIHIHKD